MSRRQCSLSVWRLVAPAESLLDTIHSRLLETAFAAAFSLVARAAETSAPVLSVREEKPNALSVSLLGSNLFGLGVSYERS